MALNAYPNGWIGLVSVDILDGDFLYRLDEVGLRESGNGGSFRFLADGINLKGPHSLIHLGPFRVQFMVVMYDGDYYAVHSEDWVRALQDVANMGVLSPNGPWGLVPFNNYNRHTVPLASAEMFHRACRRL